jgi:hypothetical protein
VAAKFAQAMVPKVSLLTSNANRRSNKWTDNRQSLRYEWMREFYRIRGDFAHGKLNTRQSAMWEPLEHLVLATIAFPLLVKSLLSKDNKYTLTNDDGAQINCFEQFADTDNFLTAPPNQQGSLDSHWRRLLDECESTSIKEAFVRVWKELKTKRGTGALSGSQEEIEIVEAKRIDK